jgi:hypothetical protein
VSAATLHPPLSYLWHFNDAPIPDATNNSLTISNVSFAQEGEYSCLVADAVATTRTRFAKLTALVTPRILNPPLDQRVVTGAPVTVSVSASGHPLPLGIEWRRNATALRSNAIAGHTDFWTFLAPTNLVTNLLYRVVIKNAAHTLPGVSTAFYLTTLADSDSDGLPDEFESGQGLNPSNPADGLEDADGDGMTNHAEYVAGTDPIDPFSYLRVEPPFFALPGAADPSLSFHAAANRTYRLEGRDFFESPWQVIADVVAAPAARDLTITDSIAGPSNRHRIYRLVTPRPVSVP